MAVSVSPPVANPNGVNGPRPQPTTGRVTQALTNLLSKQKSVGSLTDQTAVSTPFTAGRAAQLAQSVAAGGQATQAAQLPNAVPGLDPSLFQQQRDSFESIAAMLRLQAQDARAARSGGGAMQAGPPGAIPTSVAGNVNLGRQMAARQGWTGSQFNALYQLWMHESGWRTNAQNPNSTANGIPQGLANTGSTAQQQIAWGLNYIQHRYGTPARAWAFWQATVNHNAALAPPDLRGLAQTWIRHGWAGY